MKKRIIVVYGLDGYPEEIIIEHKMGHFSGPRDGITELPVVLASVLKIAQ